MNLNSLFVSKFKLFVVVSFLLASVACNSSAQNSDINQFIDLIESKGSYEVKPKTYQNYFISFINFADLQKDGATWRADGRGVQGQFISKASIRFDGFINKKGKILETSMQLTEIQFVLSTQYDFDTIDKILSKRHGKADLTKVTDSKPIKTWLVDEFSGLEISQVGKRTMIRNIVYEGNADEAY